MLLLTRRRVGGIGHLGLGTAAGKALLAAGAMAGAMYLGLAGAGQLWPGEGLGSRFLAVALPGAAGVLVYLIAARLLKLQEILSMGGLLRARLRGSRLD
jgi:hypothetical protein